MCAPKIDALSAFVSLYYAHYADPEIIVEFINLIDFVFHLRTFAEFQNIFLFFSLNGFSHTWKRTNEFSLKLLLELDKL